MSGDAGGFRGGMGIHDILSKAAEGQQQPPRPPAEGVQGEAEGGGAADAQTVTRLNIES